MSVTTIFSGETWLNMEEHRQLLESKGYCVLVDLMPDELNAIFKDPQHQLYRLICLVEEQSALILAALESGEEIPECPATLRVTEDMHLTPEQEPKALGDMFVRTVKLLFGREK